MKIIDGRKINQQIGDFLKKEIAQNNLKPSLGIICIGNEKASQTFVNVKKKFGEKCGFLVNIYKADEMTTPSEIIDLIDKVESENNSIIVQLPLPEKYKQDTQNILESINIKKDVDNLSGKNFFTSPIILALKEVLPNEINRLAIVGQGKVVGLPVKEYCENNGIDFIVIGTDNFSDIKKCDVVVSGVGIPKLIKKEFIKEDATLIDFGCSYFEEKMYGDFDDECFLVAGKYTPVPGGMGPIVVAKLFANVLESSK